MTSHWGSRSVFSFDIRQSMCSNFSTMNSNTSGGACREPTAGEAVVAARTEDAEAARTTEEAMTGKYETSEAQCARSAQRCETPSLRIGARNVARSRSRNSAGDRGCC